MIHAERPKHPHDGMTGPPPPADNPWSRSLWLEGVVENLTPRERLSGDHSCDVAIVGAGFGGLWTAYYLKAADPSLRVTVVEAEIAGFGAAGRNGGFVSAGIAGNGTRYARRGGWDSVLRAEREVQHGIDEIGRVVSSEGIDCGYRKSGALTVATTAPQLQRLRARVEAKHRFGLGPEDLRLLSADECSDLIRGPAGLLAASFTPHCARVDPARLARGLAAACERLGVKIYEQSPAEYLDSCAICHGTTGTGEGPLADQLLKHPADLTRLSERNGGEFPYWLVFATIDGRHAANQHDYRDRDFCITAAPIAIGDHAWLGLPPVCASVLSRFK